MRNGLLVLVLLIAPASLIGCGNSNDAVAPEEFVPKPPAEEMMEGKKSVQPKETG